MKIVVGCNLEEFKDYYRTLDDLHEYFKKLGLEDVKFGELGFVEEGIIKRNPSHLIILTENEEIIGHAIWHEANVDEHRKGEVRDKEDIEMLRRFLDDSKVFVELHEIWLKKKYRKKGYGNRFFNFFEDFIRKKSYDSIVFYTSNPVAIAICRRRGYKEGLLEKKNWNVFYISLY